MRLRVPTKILAAMLFLLTVLAAGSKAAQASHFALTLKVVEESSGQPIPNARILITDNETLDVLAVVTTDSLGLASAVLPPVKFSYVAEIIASGFERSFPRIRADGESEKTVEISMQPGEFTLNVKVPKEVESGTPIIGAHVEVRDTNNLQAGTIFNDGILLASGRTNSSGTISLPGIPKGIGEYTVKVRAGGYLEGARVPIRAPGPGVDSRDFTIPLEGDTTPTPVQLYWSTYHEETGDAIVTQTGSDTSSRRVIVDDEELPLGFVRNLIVDPEHEQLYFSTSLGLGVYSIKLRDESATYQRIVVLPGSRTIASFDIDFAQKKLFVLSKTTSSFPDNPDPGGTTGIIHVAPLDGTESPQEVFTNIGIQSPINEIKIDPIREHIYFATLIDPDSPSVGARLKRSTYQGTNVQTVATLAGHRFSLDDDYVYWSNKFGYLRHKTKLDDINQTEDVDVQFRRWWVVGDAYYGANPTGGSSANPYEIKRVSLDGQEEDILVDGGASGFIDMYVRNLETVTVDNNDPGYSEFPNDPDNPVWHESTASDEFRDSSRYTKAEGAYAIFAPTLPRAGRYEVLAWWSALSPNGKYKYSRAIEARFTISHLGTDEVVSINQNDGHDEYIEKGLWVPLGHYDFAADGTESVRVSFELTPRFETLNTDAIKFRLVSPLRPDTSNCSFDDAGTLIECEENFDGCDDGKECLGFLTHGRGDGSWTRWIGSTPAEGTGPEPGDPYNGTEASSGNFYYYLGEPMAGTATLKTLSFAPAARVNFQFWYHIWGHGIKSLHVDALVDGQWRNPWSVYNDFNQHGQAWHRANIDIAGSGITQVRIRGTKGNSLKFNAAIDDVLLRVESCPDGECTPAETLICPADRVYFGHNTNLHQLDLADPFFSNLLAEPSSGTGSSFGQFAADTNHLYYRSKYKISRSDMDGNDSEDIIEYNDGTIQQIRLDPQNNQIYFSVALDSPPGTARLSALYRANTDGTNLMRLTDGIHWKSFGVVDGKEVYWLDSFRGRGEPHIMHKKNVDTGVVEDFMTYPSFPGFDRFTIDSAGKYLYYEFRTGHTIQRIDLATKEVSTVITIPEELRPQLPDILPDLAPDFTIDEANGHIYYTALREDRRIGLYRADLDGENKNVILIHPAFASTGLAVRRTCD